MHTTHVKVFHVAASLHPKHLVALAYVNDEWRAHKVGTKGYFRGVQTLTIEDVLHQTRVEDDIAMVAYKEVIFV